MSSNEEEDYEWLGHSHPNDFEKVIRGEISHWLDFSGQHLGDDRVIYIMGILEVRGLHVRSLDLSENKMTYLSFKALTRFLERPSALTDLMLHNNGAGNTGIDLLCKSLSCSEGSLRRLELGYNQISLEGIKALADCLRNSRLESLALQYNNLEDTEVGLLAVAIPCSQLHTIELFGNRITSLGAKYLGLCLKSRTCKLTCLNLGENNVGDEGVTYISEAIRDFPNHLRELFLWHNEITDIGANALSDALRSKNCILRKLFLRENNISRPLSLVQAPLNLHCRLHRLDLQQNPIDADQKLHFIEVIKRTRLILILREGSLEGSYIFQLELFKKSLTFKVLLAICSTQCIPRIRAKTCLRLLTTDLIRILACTMLRKKYLK